MHPALNAVTRKLAFVVVNVTTARNGSLGQ